MRKVSLCLLVLVLSLLSSCNKQKATEQPQASQSSSAFKMTLTTEPAPPVEEQGTTFKLTVADESGRPVTGAEVKADLKMASMDMGKNDFTLVDKGAGNYEGKGTFSMAGPWKVIVTAAQGGKSGQQTFDIVAHKK